MKKNKTTKKQIFIVILISILMIMVIGSSYSIFYYQREGNTSNVIGTKAITCSFNEETPISITSALPISDEIGKKLTSGIFPGYDQGYYDVSLSCDCQGPCNGVYEIYALNLSDEPKLDPKYVKVYVTDGEEVETEVLPVTKFHELKESSIEKDSKIIYRGEFSKDFSKKFRLRLWVSEEYEIDNIERNFKTKLNAKINE